MKPGKLLENQNKFSRLIEGELVEGKGLLNRWAFALTSHLKSNKKNIKISNSNTRNGK